MAEDEKWMPLPPGFAEWAGRPDDRLDLLPGAWWIARAEYPDLDPAAGTLEIDWMAAELRECVTDREDPAAIAQGLRTVLFQNRAFRGNVNDYHDPRNSYLNDVLARKLGIPITLSLLYLEVARRAGFGAQGIGFPGHFLVGLELGGERRILDPFGGGLELTPADLRLLLRQVYDEPPPLSPRFLEPVGARAILVRMLANLKAAYLQREDLPRALRSVEMLLALAPGQPGERRDRGLLLQAMDEDFRALTDLEEYLAAAPEAEDAPRIAEYVQEIRSRLARWN